MSQLFSGKDTVVRDAFSFRSIRCKKQAFPVRKRYSVQETASYGTGGLFRGARNSTCHIERISRGPQNSTCCTECLFRGARISTCRTGRIFSARNGLREEASKHKERALIKVYQDFLDPRSARTVAAACRILRRRCLFQKNVKKRVYSLEMS